MGMFWIIVLIAVVLIFLRPRHYSRRLGGREPLPPLGGSRHERGRRLEGREADLEGYVEALETRVAHLEERLDFTERLLQERSEKRE